MSAKTPENPGKCDSDERTGFRVREEGVARGRGADEGHRRNCPQAGHVKEGGFEPGISWSGGCFFLAINNLAHPVVVAFVASFAGCSVGFGLYLAFAQKQWPVTRKYIDMNSVQKRLNELQR